MADRFGDKRHTLTPEERNRGRAKGWETRRERKLWKEWLLGKISIPKRLQAKYNELNSYQKKKMRFEVLLDMAFYNGFIENRPAEKEFLLQELSHLHAKELDLPETQTESEASESDIRDELKRLGVYE